MQPESRDYYRAYRVLGHLSPTSDAYQRLKTAIQTGKDVDLLAAVIGAEIELKAFDPHERRDPLGRWTSGEWHVTPMVQSRGSTQARATPQRRQDLLERDAMEAALRTLDTDRLRRMLDWIEQNPRHPERWDSLTVAGVQKVVDPKLLRAELARRQ